MWPFSFFSSSPVGKIRTFKDPRTDDLFGSVMRHDQVIPWVPLSSSSTLDICLITNVLAFLTGTAWHIKWHGRRTDSWSIGCVIAPPLRTNYRGMWPLKGINYFSLQVVEHYQFLSVLAAFIYLICIYPLSLCLFGVLFAGLLSVLRRRAPAFITSTRCQDSFITTFPPLSAAILRMLQQIRATMN